MWSSRGQRERCQRSQSTDKILQVAIRLHLHYGIEYCLHTGHRLNREHSRATGVRGLRSYSTNSKLNVYQIPQTPLLGQHQMQEQQDLGPFRSLPPSRFSVSQMTINTGRSPAANEADSSTKLNGPRVHATLISQESCHR